MIFRFLKRILKKCRTNRQMSLDLFRMMRDLDERQDYVEMRLRSNNSLLGDCLVKTASLAIELNSELTTQKISILNLQQDLEKLKNDFEFWSSEE